MRYSEFLHAMYVLERYSEQCRKSGFENVAEEIWTALNHLTSARTMLREEVNL